MESDIILEGSLVKLKATDLLLDADVRRTFAGTSEHRRALVHGEGDELIVNFARDYPGGVTLMGPVHLSDLEAPSSGGDSEVEGMVPVRIPANVPEVKLSEPDVSILLEGADRADLIATIRVLRRAVLSMDRRLKALES